MNLPDEDRNAARAGTKGGFDPGPWRAELLAFLRRAGAGADAEDIVQEAFLRALERPPESSARAWLYRVSLNVLRDRRRRDETGARASRAAARPEAEDSDPAGLAEAHGLAAAAWCAVRKLPERQRLALYLRIQRHMDYDEIGTVLECSAATSRQHFHLAVKTVRNLLAGDDRHE